MKKTVKRTAPEIKSNIQFSAAGDIVELIKRDHKPLKALIKILKDSDLERSDKEEPLEEFVMLLTTHAKSEEKSLYVAMKEYDDLKIESYEGDTEHSIAETLIQEINASPLDEEWLAKVKVLAEVVEHHIIEEETKLLKAVQKSIDLEIRKVIGEDYENFMTEYNLVSTPQSLRKNRIPKSVNSFVN